MESKEGQKESALRCDTCGAIVAREEMEAHAKTHSGEYTIFVELKEEGKDHG